MNIPWTILPSKMGGICIICIICVQGLTFEQAYPQEPLKNRTQHQWSKIFKISEPTLQQGQATMEHTFTQMRRLANTVNVTHAPQELMLQKQQNARPGKHGRSTKITSYSKDLYTLHTIFTTIVDQTSRNSIPHRWTHTWWCGSDILLTFQESYFWEFSLNMIYSHS